jgi:Zn-dependent protease with chaperone function
MWPGELTADDPKYGEHYKAVKKLVDKLTLVYGAEAVGPLKIHITGRVSSAGIQGGKIIAVNPGLLDSTSPKTFAAIIAHEYGHKLLQHEVWKTGNEESRANECAADAFSAYYTSPEDFIPHFEAEKSEAKKSTVQDKVDHKRKTPITLWESIFGIQDTNRRTHPTHDERIKLLKNPIVTSALPGTIQFDGECNVVGSFSVPRGIIPKKTLQP